ncbi:GTPase IMAP family member 4-like isoform X2 [Phycodurus eques]|uniref:GTPase IMAP family member 4-like isoform X2 n=1 Tax=Phycodurus eques TaxID=693459 RepID=UPI002ACF000D|nr:GTPase IMAP family member 4-like isoform X2 [Phycodurus eques]
MDCKCETSNTEDAVTGWWLSGSNAQWGAFTVVGYLLYRFSQTLPALIRWPIRLFCSLTGLSALWGWVSRIVGTLRGIQSLCKWLSRIWKFIKAFSSKFHWMLPIIRSITGSSEGSLENENIRLNLSSPLKAGLRLILVGPAGGGRTSVANTLLGCSAEQPEEHLMESTKRRAIVDGRELTVVDTPDILGVSLGRITRAKEGLRSVQLVGPGPHAVLLVMQAPRSSNETHQETMQVIQAILDLFGDGIRGHVIPVLTHADRLGRRHTFERLLDTDVGGVKRLTSLCGQRPELLDTRPDRSPEEQSVTRRLLVGRVLELKGLWGHFIHELQRRDERIREELLADMTSALSRKLGHM